MYNATLKKEDDVLVYSFDELANRAIGEIYSGDNKGCFVVKIAGDDGPILAELTGKFYLKGQELEDLGENIKLLEPERTINIFLAGI